MIGRFKKYFAENYKEMLSTVGYLLCLMTSLFLFVGGISDYTASTDLPYWLFIILAVLDIGFIVSFIIFEKKVNKMPINIPFIICLSTLFIANILVIATTPLVRTIIFTYWTGEKASAVVEINNMDKLVFIFRHSLILLHVYTDVMYVLHRFKAKKQFLWLALIIMLFSFTAIVYSYIAEGEKYALFFSNITGALKGDNPESFLFSPNNYGAAILGGLFCAISCQIITKKKFFYFVALFFLLNIMFPMSRLCLILAVGCLLFFFIYKIITTWKDHAFRNINFIIIVSIILTLTILICVFVPDVRKYLEEVIFIHSGTLTGRTELWGRVFEITSDWRFVFGNGHGYFNVMYASVNAVEYPDYVIKSPHNLYLQAFGAGGIVLLVALATLLGFIIYHIIKLYKENRDSFYVSIFGLILFLSYFVFEG